MYSFVGVFVCLVRALKSLFRLIEHLLSSTYIATAISTSSSDVTSLAEVPVSLKIATTDAR